MKKYEKITAKKPIGVFGTILLNTNLPVLAKYSLLMVTAYIGNNLLISAYYAVKQA